MNPGETFEKITFEHSDGFVFVANEIFCHGAKVIKKEKIRRVIIKAIHNLFNYFIRTGLNVFAKAIDNY